jgi:hypothetical protein
LSAVRKARAYKVRAKDGSGFNERES